MSETLNKSFVDRRKPKGERETVIALTSEEIAAREARAAEAAAEQAQREKEAADLAAAKQSAQDKLAELGLTDLEIAAITGA